MLTSHHKCIFIIQFIITMVCYAIVGAAEGQGNTQNKFEIILFLANMTYCVKSYSLLLIGIGFREKDDQRIKKSLQSKTLNWRECVPNHRQDIVFFIPAGMLIQLVTFIVAQYVIIN